MPNFRAFAFRRSSSRELEIAPGERSSPGALVNPKSIWASAWRFKNMRIDLDSSDTTNRSDRLGQVSRKRDGRARKATGFCRGVRINRRSGGGRGGVGGRAESRGNQGCAFSGRESEETPSAGGRINRTKIWRAHVERRYTPIEGGAKTRQAAHFLACSMYRFRGTSVRFSGRGLSEARLDFPGMVA